MRTGFAREEVALEGLRGTLARRLQSMALGAGVSLISALVCIVSLGEIHQLEAQWREQIYAGSNVLSITAVGASAGGTLDGYRCDAMRSIDGVRSAGAILHTEEVFAATSPKTRLTLVTTTPGYLQVAYPRDSRAATASTVAGASVVAELGLTDDGYFAYLTSGQADVISIQVDLATRMSARREPLDNAVLVASGRHASTYECLVEAQPGALDGLVSVAAAWFAPTEVKVTPELPNNDLVGDPTPLLQGRFGQWLPLTAGVALVVFLLITWWARRADYASYRALGLGVSQLALLLTAETAVSFWIPIVVGYASACVFFAPVITPLAAQLLLNDYGALLLTVSLAPLLGAWMLGSRSAFRISKGE